MQPSVQTESDKRHQTAMTFTKYICIKACPIFDKPRTLGRLLFWKNTVHTGIYLANQKNDAFILENRAKPSREELQAIFEEHIQSGTLALTDGLRSYSVLETLADCKVEDVNVQESGFYNLNTVNNLHSFIKGRYIFYRGVATKYLNRYNALFQIVYRSIESKITLLIEKLFRPGCTMNIHTVKDIATHNLLAV